MNFFILFATIFFITACSTTKKPFSDNRFYPEAEKYFSNYHYEVVSTSNKSNFSVFQLEVNENLLTIEKLYLLKDKLKETGWIYNYDIDGYYWSYCRDSSNESLRIYLPNHKVEKTKNGEYLNGGLKDNVVHIIFSQYNNKDDNLRFTECMGNT